LFLRVSYKIVTGEESYFVALDLIYVFLADKTRYITSRDSSCKEGLRIEAVIYNPWPAELMSAVRERFRKLLILEVIHPVVKSKM
jgi:hypothetical protein